MTPKAGWYTDPDDKTQLRYWDGSVWSATPMDTPDNIPKPPPSWPEAILDNLGRVVSGVFFD